MSRLVLLVALWGAGCTKANPKFCTADTDCGIGGVCDLDGITGPKNTCITAQTCQSSNDCPSDVAPLCDTDQNLCVPCTNLPNDCASKYPNRTICAASGACVGCEDESDCTIDAPICSASDFVCSTCDNDQQCLDTYGADRGTCSTTGRCIECEDSDQCANASEPVCGADNLCRPCQENSECDSGVCNQAQGTCVGASNIVRVASTGSAAPCGRPGQQPCEHLLVAIDEADSDDFILILDTVELPYTIVTDSVRITGVTNAALEAQDSIGLDITCPVPTPIGGCNMNVLLQSIRITEAGKAIECHRQNDANNSLALTLINVEVDQASDLVLLSDECDLDVQRSLFTNGDKGGILAIQGTVSITNSIFASNGDSAIDLIGPQTFTHLEFNTLAGNQAQGSDANDLQCDQNAQGAVLKNSIALGGNSVFKRCEASYTYTTDNSQDGINNNIIGDLTLSQDYRLPAGSPAIDEADPSVMSGVDIDNQPRPYGIAADMGADEFHP